MMDKTFVMPEDAWLKTINELRNGYVLRIDVWDIIPEEYIPYDAEKPNWYIRGKDGCEIKKDKEYLIFEFMGKDSDFQWFMNYAKTKIDDVYFDCEKNKTKKSKSDKHISKNSNTMGM